MTDELKTAIENLYSSFSVYPSKSIMESYICCVSYADKESRTTNKPIAYMAVDVKTQALVLRKNNSDYPQCSLIEPPRMQLPKRYVPAGDSTY